MKHWKLVLALVLVVAILGAIGAVVSKRSQKRNQPGISSQTRPRSDTARGPASAKACPDGPIFSILPMQLQDFTAFRPLGFVTFPGHVFGAKHSNFVVNQLGESKKGLEVRFPSDAIVTQITSTKSQKGSSYQLNFFPCREFKSYFFHLGTISQSLESAFKQGQPNCQEFKFGLGDDITKCELRTEVAVKRGELVGTNDGSAGVDWGAVDYRVEQTFANRERYDGDYPHYVSPVPYLTPVLRDQMIERLASYDGSVKRTADPRWGTIAQDIPGTAQGNWFLGDRSFRNTQDFSIFLALLHDYIDPTEPLIVMGSSVKGLQLGIYSFAPDASGVINRDFKDIKPDGKTYCYDNFKTGQSVGKISLGQVSGRILMAMPDDKTLKVEYQNSSCGQTPYRFTGQETMFSR